MEPSHNVDQQQTPPPPPIDLSALLPPGYHFHPTDQELILEYLMKKVKNEPVFPIADMIIETTNPMALTETPANPLENLVMIRMPSEYRFMSTDQQELIHEYLMPIADMTEANLKLINNPMALITESSPRIGERKSYFFMPRNKNYQNGKLPDPENGFWKPNGVDKPVEFEGRIIGFKRRLDFFQGPPKSGGTRTNWRMYEYRLNSDPLDIMRLDDWVLCHIYQSKSASRDHGGGGRGINRSFQPLMWSGAENI